MIKGSLWAVSKLYPTAIENMDARLQHPFSMILAGPSNCGKSYFIKNVLQYADHVLSVKPDNVVWFYSCWQPLYKELMSKYSFIRFVEGLPSTLDDDVLLPPDKVNLVILDDLMEKACENESVQVAFTKLCHHKNLSIIYVVQNLFCSGKQGRTISLNAKYIVLFKNPRDKQQISVLARQMYPKNTAFFLDAFNDATVKPYHYLLIDLQAATPETYRLRSGLFPPDLPAVYVPKKPSGPYKRR